MDRLILINSFYPLPEGFEKGLMLTKAGGRTFEQETGRALERMLAAARNEGIEISVISGYRSTDYQQLLWERSVNDAMRDGLSYENALELTRRTLALPGCSEHNAGIAADLGTPGSDDCEEDFHRTPQGRWLCVNAHLYGFILRYPRMKEHITGISYEPWHYRYVGPQAAALIKESGCCLEEFLHFYSDRFTLPCKNSGPP